MSWTLVTGASSGIGKEFCEQIAALGHNVVLVARRQPELQQVAERLANVYGVETEILPADLRDPDQLARVCARISQTEKPISLLVNGAGFALNQNFLSADLPREIAALEVMVKAVLLLSWHAGMAMKKRGRGAIINISSMVQNTTMGTYAAHKTWVDNFSLNLAEELRGTGVRVLALRPGTTRTAFFDRSINNVENMPTICRLEPAQVVEQALQDLARGKQVSIPGWSYRGLHALAMLCPPSLRSRATAWYHRNRFRF